VGGVTAKPFAKPMEGISMRKTIVFAAAATLMLAGAAGAQQQPAPQSSPAPATPAPATPKPPTIESVSIVDITELPKDTQTQVNQIVAQRGDAGLQTLRKSIDATPKVSTASEVIEPVAEKLSPRSERIAGSEGGIAKRITRRLKAVSQTSPSEMTVRRKGHHASGQIFDESGTGL